MREVSKELGYVYITSSGDEYTRKEDAINQQAQINAVLESKKYIKRRKEVDAKKVLEILSEHGWGLYYKANPIHQLSVQDSVPIFSVNAVNEEELLEALISTQEGDDTWHSETDSTQ